MGTLLMAKSTVARHSFAAVDPATSVRRRALNSTFLKSFRGDEPRAWIHCLMSVMLSNAASGDSFTSGSANSRPSRVSCSCDVLTGIGTSTARALILIQADELQPWGAGTGPTQPQTLLGLLSPPSRGMMQRDEEQQGNMLREMEQQDELQ